MADSKVIPKLTYHNEKWEFLFLDEDVKFNLNKKETLIFYSNNPFSLTVEEQALIDKATKLNL